MVDIAQTLAEREQLRQDIKRSEELRAGIRAKLARGKDHDVLTGWDDIERLDAEIARSVRQLADK
jgi:hypothetical protein